MDAVNLQVRSTVTEDGKVDLALVEARVTDPGLNEVVVRIEAAPINPADLVPLLAGASPANFTFGSGHGSARLSDSDIAFATNRSRIGAPMAVGLEGAGTVVATGSGAEHLMGKRVAVMAITGGTFARYATFPAQACVLLPEGVSARQGAALFTNPLTALAMVETLRFEGQMALVHTAAASNLGKMLARICAEDGLSLVAIVRSAEQAEVLRALGVRWICNSSEPSFDDDLHKALVETGATTAFDAISGGPTAGKLVAAMERAAVARSDHNSPFGSSTFKQVFVYGSLDPSPTILPRSGYGMTWSVTGWAMPPVLDRAGPQRYGELIQRILAGITTTFASEYSEVIALNRLLDAKAMQGYTSLTTGGKYLIDPWG